MSNNEKRTKLTVVKNVPAADNSDEDDGYVSIFSRSIEELEADQVAGMEKVNAIILADKIKKYLLPK